MKVPSLGRMFALVLIGVAVLFAWIGTESSPLRQYSLDVPAQKYVEDGLKRAFVTFATARTLNAALSVVQGTQFSAQPLGVGVQVSLGQLIRPVNDIVGQFADLMLIACIAFGAMEILIRIGSHWSITLTLSIVALTYVTYCLRSAVVPLWIGKVLAGLLLLRFAVPTVSIGSDAVYRTFMAEDYKASQQAIALSTDRIGKDMHVQPSLAADKCVGCWMLPDWLCKKPESRSSVDQKTGPKAEAPSVDRGKAGGLTEVPEWMVKLRDAAEKMTENVVTLMVVFLLQTLIIPLVLGWVLLRGAGALLQWPSRTAS